MRYLERFLVVAVAALFSYLFLSSVNLGYTPSLIVSYGIGIIVVLTWVFVRFRTRS